MIHVLFGPAGSTFVVDQIDSATADLVRSVIESVEFDRLLPSMHHAEAA
jgi:hypothetical protein